MSNGLTRVIESDKNDYNLYVLREWRRRPLVKRCERGPAIRALGSCPELCHMTVFVICKMQKSKKKSICNLFQVLFIFTATVVAGVSRSSSSGRWCGRWTVKSAVWSPLRPYPSRACCPVQSEKAALVEKCVVAFPRSTRYTLVFTVNTQPHT